MEDDKYIGDTLYESNLNTGIFFVVLCFIFLVYVISLIILQ